MANPNPNRIIAVCDRGPQIIYDRLIVLVMPVVFVKIIDDVYENGRRELRVHGETRNILISETR